MRSFKLLLVLAIVSGWGCGTRKGVTHSSTQNLEDKYAQMLGVNRSNITNKRLYTFIDDWYGAPYQYAGKTKKGVDCSGLTSVLLREVYEKELSGSSASLYNQCKRISKEELQEGDLVFFRIDSKEISHVGVYLQNDKFFHATTKGGVMIDDLKTEYYRKSFEGGGKIK